MKVIIFAGGSGTRFWPISRVKYPKQFQPIINNKSTIEMLVEAVQPLVGWNNLFFSTTETLVSLIKEKFPLVPTLNIITEPEQKDVGPAVGLAMSRLQKHRSGGEPVVILWSDGFVANTEVFQKALTTGEEMILKNPKQLVYLGEKPKFANENIGWIALGAKHKVEGVETEESFDLAGFKYRPELKLAEEWYKDGKHLWNTGYFLTTADFVLEQIAKNNSEVSQGLKQIEEAMGEYNESEVLQAAYTKLPSIHFDNLVLDFLEKSQTLVMAGDFGWFDPGTLYALKQFLQESNEANVTKGQVETFETKDSLVYNYVKNQLVSVVALEGAIVVNTPDALLVTNKENIGKIKEMLKTFKGGKLEKYL